MPEETYRMFTLDEFRIALTKIDPSVMILMMQAEVDPTNPIPGVRPRFECLLTYDQAMSLSRELRRIANRLQQPPSN